MLHDWGVIAVAFGYIGFLFLVASYGDRLSPDQRGRASGLIYPLSLAIYCTSWTYFGSVGSATRASIDFLAIYVGPVLMIGLCTPMLRRVIHLAKSQNITSIADFIGARYGKSQAVAVTVAVIAIVGSLGPSIANMYLAFALVAWISFARIVRGEVLVLKQQEYVQAALVLGYSHWRILLRHVLPNAITPAIVFMMSDVVLTILAVTALGFLGLGIQPPTPEWGVMIAEGYSFLARAPWISAAPGLVIVALAAAFSLFGDGLADYLRPEIER